MQLWKQACPKFAGQTNSLQTQAEFPCYSLEAEFHLLQETTVFALMAFD